TPASAGATKPIARLDLYPPSHLQRAIGQYQHFAVAAALLGANERGFDLLDRIERVDRRLQHAVAELDREVGIEFAHLRVCRLLEAVAETKASEGDAARQGGAADRRVLSRHRTVADHDAAIGDAVGDPPAGLAGHRIDAEPDRRAADRRACPLGQIGPVL